MASAYGLRPEPWYLGIAFAASGLAISVLLIKDTAPHVRIESAELNTAVTVAPSLARSFAHGTWRDAHLAGISQAGFVNNLNDGLAWGIFPLYFASRGLSLDRIAVLAAIYPLVWGGLQIGTGWASDWLGRKAPIVSGMALQAIAISIIGFGDDFGTWLAALAVLGLGTAMVYPALLAATGDAVPPGERATALGVYRFWRDGGAIAGALIAGALADLFSFNIAIQVVAALTAASGIIAAGTLRGQRASLGVPV
jgi:MFS family permease